MAGPGQQGKCTLTIHHQEGHPEKMCTHYEDGKEVRWIPHGPYLLEQALKFLFQHKGISFVFIPSDISSHS